MDMGLIKGWGAAGGLHRRGQCLLSGGKAAGAHRLGGAGEGFVPRCKFKVEGPVAVNAGGQTRKLQDIGHIRHRHHIGDAAACNGKHGVDLRGRRYGLADAGVAAAHIGDVFGGGCHQTVHALRPGSRAQAVDTECLHSDGPPYLLYLEMMLSEKNCISSRVSSRVLLAKRRAEKVVTPAARYASMRSMISSGEPTRLRSV